MKIVKKNLPSVFIKILRGHHTLCVMTPQYFYKKLITCLCRQAGQYFIKKSRACGAALPPDELPRLAYKILADSKS